MTFYEIYFIIGALISVCAISTTEYKFTTFSEILSFLLSVAAIWTLYPIFVAADLLKYLFKN